MWEIKRTRKKKRNRKTDRCIRPEPNMCSGSRSRPPAEGAASSGTGWRPSAHTWAAAWPHSCWRRGRPSPWTRSATRPRSAWRPSPSPSPVTSRGGTGKWSPTRKSTRSASSATTSFTSRRRICTGPRSDGDQVCDLERPLGLGRAHDQVRGHADDYEPD